MTSLHIELAFDQTVPLDKTKLSSNVLDAIELLAEVEDLPILTVSAVWA